MVAYYDKKLGPLELWWFTNFDLWGLGVVVERTRVPASYWSVGFTLGPLQFGVHYVNE